MSHEELVTSIAELDSIESKAMATVYEVLYSLRNQKNEVHGHTQSDFSEQMFKKFGKRWSVGFIAQMIKKLKEQGYLYMAQGTRGTCSSYAFPKEENFVKPTWEEWSTANTTNEYKIRKAFEKVRKIVLDCTDEEEFKELLQIIYENDSNLYRAVISTKEIFDISKEDNEVI